MHFREVFTDGFNKIGNFNFLCCMVHYIIFKYISVYLKYFVISFKGKIAS